MRRTLFAFTLLLATAATCLAGPTRDWTDNTGKRTKAEFMGVKGTQVVLRKGRQRIYVPFANFSEADQVWIRNHLKADGKAHLIPPSAPQATPGAVNNGEMPAVDEPVRFAGTGGVTADNPLKGQVPIPYPDMLQAPFSRTWTDVRGGTVLAKFVGLDDRGQIKLMDRVGKTTAFEAVGFVEADIDYVKQAIADDQATTVIPANAFVQPTPDQEAAGYTIVTDRNGNRVTGKFVRSEGPLGRVTLTTLPSDRPETFFYNGLSSESRDWVEAQVAEQKRKAEEARRAAEERARQAEAERQSRMSSSSPYGRSGTQPRSSTWPRPSAFDYSPPKWEYRFNCTRCGHTWTRENTPIDRCPKCRVEMEAKRQQYEQERQQQRQQALASLNSRPSTSAFSSPSSTTASSKPKSKTYVIPVGLIASIIFIVVGAVVGGLKKLFGIADQTAYGSDDSYDSRSQDRPKRRRSSADENDTTWI